MTKNQIFDRNFLKEIRNAALKAAYDAEESGGNKFGFIDAFYALADSADRLDALVFRSIAENSKELMVLWNKEWKTYKEYAEVDENPTA